MSLLHKGLQLWTTRVPKQLLNICNVSSRPFSNSSILLKGTASFDDVKSVENNKKILLIDVREPQELQETGVIPGSINIPLGEVESVLRDMSPEQFQKRYSREKPQFGAPLIFSCKLGKRSGNAQEIATRLGFTNVKNYEGGWMDWEERIK